MSLREKIDAAINQYRMEIKIIRDEQKLLTERESEAFRRFLDNCEKSYEDIFLGRYVNPFKKPWCELGEQKQLEVCETEDCKEEKPE